MTFELIIGGARVRTLDPARPLVDAVAIRGGRVAAVGGLDELRSLDSRCRVVSLDGATIVPGLVDTHQHAFWGARQTRHGDISTCATLDAALTELAAARRRAGEGWVVAHGLRRSHLRGLDADPADVIGPALGDGPALVTFVDGHGGVATRAALAAAAITGPVAFDDASEVVCDPTGRPTGELREPGALQLLRTAIPAMGASERRTRYREVLERMAASGLTGVHLMDGSAETVDDLRAMEDGDELPVRVVAPVWFQPGHSMDEVHELFGLRGAHGRRWSGGVAKFFLDGVIGSGTAWLHEPDANGRGQEPFWPEIDHFAEVVRLAVAAGFRCVTHAIGDRAVTTVLAAYRAAGPPAVGLHRIEHLELVRPPDVAEVGRAGIACGMQPLHLDRDARDGLRGLRSLLGAERVDGLYPCRSLADGGAVIALGSDWPVAPFPPLLGLAWARLRRPPGEPQIAPVGPEHRLTADEALAGYTVAAARVAGESLGGRIVPGAPADLTILGADPVETDPDELPGVGIVGTVIAGEPRLV